MKLAIGCDEAAYALKVVIMDHLKEIGVEYDDFGADKGEVVLYPDVARKHGSTPQRVEKAIRHAIEVAWMIDENNPIHKEFKYIMGAGKDRPTNSEFIAKLTQDVRLKYYKQTIAC